MMLKACLTALASLALGPSPVLAGGRTPIVLSNSNYDTEIGTYEYILVAFGASWCPYSRQLEPTWDSAAAAYDGKMF